MVADIPDAAHGFVMVFSGRLFPGHQFKLDWTRSDGTGNWHRCEELQMEGWLCANIYALQLDRRGRAAGI